MLSISAINDNESSRSQNLAPTREAQECHLQKLYQDGLLCIQTNDFLKARSLFQAIILDPLSIKAQKGATDSLLHLRFLTLRNLGETYVKQGPEFYKDALQCYIQAVSIDEKDVVLWNRLGTLACSLGRLNIARKAFEQGLHCSPRHWSCMEKLAEVLIAIGDETSCLSVAKRLLRLHPSHPRALQIKRVIEQQQVRREPEKGIGVLGFDSLEPKHSNLTFEKKRKLEVNSEVSKPKKRIQHSIQLSFSSAAWLHVVKAALEAFQNRVQGKVSKSEELKDRGSYLANSRVLFSIQSPDDTPASTSEPVKLFLQTSEANLSGEIIAPGEKDGGVKLVETEERRSTRSRSRKVDKIDDAAAISTKSLAQLLERFVIVIEQAPGEVKQAGELDEGAAGSQKMDGCLIFSASGGSVELSGDEQPESEEVLQFIKEYSDNSGLYHVAQGILGRASSRGGNWRDEGYLLLELERNTRQWGRSRSFACNLFLAELWLDAVGSNKLPDPLGNCNYSICLIVESLTLDVTLDQESSGLEEGSWHDRCGWVFWVRFHWLNGRFCMFSGSSARGFSEFKKCLSLLQARREAFAGIVLPHCKADNRISVETVEQKLYEFEVGDLLQSVGKLGELEKHGEVIDALVPVLFSERATRNEVWIAGRYEEALRSNEFKALGMLVSACRRVKPVMNLPVELRCHLRKLERICRCAGILSSKPEDEPPLLHSPGSGSPSSLEMESDKLKATRPWHKGIAEQVKQLSRCAAMLKEKVAGYSIDSSILGRIQWVLLMVLEHFGSGVSCKRHSNLNLSEHFETGLIVDAAMAFCSVQQLKPSVSLQQQVALLVTMHEILAERGVCGAGASSSCEDGEGAFLKMAIKHLLAIESKLKQELSEALPPEKRSEELEKKKAAIGLECALDQFFFCLYGLNLKADSESGFSSSLAIHRTTTCGEFQTKGQCAAVLQYVLPYAKSNSKAGLTKLKQVLQAVRKQFPQPPSHILAGNVIDTFMDDLSFDEARFAEMVMAKASVDELFGFAFPKPEEEPAAAVLIYSTPGSEKKSGEAEAGAGAKAESYTEVYENLYYLLAQVEDMSPNDKMPGYVLSKEGEELIEHNASLYKYDLLYNMQRFDSWHKLAATYDEEVDLLLNDGSKSVNALEWRRNSRYTSRVENSRRRSRRCYLMSLALANTQTHEMHELLALVYYDTLQNTVPSYDQRLFAQKKDAVWINKCLNAYKHFEAAYSQRPDWTHLFYLGKLSEKLGKPGEQYLSLYKRTIDMNPFAVDPVYRLHRSRLKLLCRGRYHDLSIIEVVAKYCFHKQTEELAASKLNALSQPDEKLVQVSGESRQAEIASLWRLLFKDCMSAMQACVDGELKHFHKARFSMAQGFHLRADEGDWERAKEELAFCFRSSRSLFTVNMWELDGVVNKKNKKKATGSTHAKKLGLPESSRKFITCVRKYLLLYIMLCEKAGDFVTLERAYVTIRTDKRFSICLEDIGNVALTSYVHSLGAAIKQAEQAGGYVNNTPLQGLLERMFNLFMDQGGSWPEASSEGGGNNTSEDERSVYCYIHRYLQYLENECRADALELVNERIKRRLRSPKASASSHFLQHAKLAWCRALCSGLASITPLGVDQHSQLIVDLQCEALLSSPYDAEFLSKISEVSGAGAREGSSNPPASAAFISRIRRLPVAQVSPENTEKALGFLRAAFFYYREVTSGPFPGGINMFLATSGDVSEVLEHSTPRKLLLWAFALVYGRVVNISDVVKHCEEQAKLRLKKWPAAIQVAPAAVALVAPAVAPAVAPVAPVVHCQAPVQEKPVVASSSKGGGGEAREPGMEIDLNVVDSTT